MAVPTMARTEDRVVRRPAAAAPPSNKHQQRTAATRQALLDSARRIFARDGFEAARIEDVAAGTGHTRGAFYAHFRTKEDLFFALFEQEAERRIQQIRAALALLPIRRRNGWRHCGNSSFPASPTSAGPC